MFAAAPASGSLAGTPPGSLAGTPLLDLNNLINPSGTSPGNIPAGATLWPFPTRSASQYRRIDQGWDLQYAGTRPVPVYAITSGVFGIGSNPGGFGSSYPTETATGLPGGQTGVYYGHVLPNPKLRPGQPIHAGQVIGYTSAPGGAPGSPGTASTPNWLEIGFLGPGGSYPVMGQGTAMQRFLARALPISAFRKLVTPKPTTSGLRTPALPRPVPPPKGLPPRTLPLLPPPRKPPARKPRAAPSPHPGPRPSPRARAHR